MGSRLRVWIWKMREAVLAGAKIESKDEKDEDEPPLIARSLKQTELGESSKQAEPTEGVGDVAGDTDNIEVVEPVMSQEYITKD